MASMSWAPMNLGDFCSPVEQQQFIQLRKWLSTTCTSLLAQASPQLEANLAQCSQHGCTMTSCPLHTGCVLFTAQTLVQTGAVTDVTMEWRSLLSLTAFKRHKLLQAALDYDRASEVCVLILIPSDILALLLVPEALPCVGVFGVGRVSLADLAKGLVTLCFQEAASHLPEGVTQIDPSMLPLDPTDPNKLPPVHILGLEGDGVHGPPHASLPFMPWGSDTGYRYDLPAPANPASAASGAARGSRGDVGDQRPDDNNDDDDVQTRGDTQEQENRIEPGQQQQEGQGRSEQEEQEQGSEERSVEQLPAAIPLTPAQQRLYLQATIIMFWMTVGDMSQRLTNRVRKIRCRERIARDGVSCHGCRGAMVFTAAALEGPAGQAWRYVYQGGELMSNTPKQYLRGEWRTVYELVQGLGSLDVELMKTVITHDRKRGYVQALHIPRHLVADCLPHAPPAGLLFWRLCTHPDQAIGTHLLNGSANLPRGLAGTPPSASPRGSSPALPPIKSEYSYRSEEEEIPTATRDEQPTDGEGAAGAPSSSPPSPPGPRQCCLAGCGVLEERFSGVQLLVCSGCKAAWYCTPEHQRTDWRARHRKTCAAAAVAAESSGPRNA